MNGRIYIFGGENLSGRTFAQERMNLDTLLWEAAPSVNLMLTANTYTSYKGSIYILSGSTEFGDIGSGGSDPGKNYFYRYTPGEGD